MTRIPQGLLKKWLPKEIWVDYEEEAENVGAELVTVPNVRLVAGGLR